MSETILVLGASGYLGRRLLGVPSGGTVVGTFHEHPLSGCLFLDLRDPAGIDQALRRLSPSVVLYAAGLTDVDACERDPAAAWRLNAQAAAEVASYPGVRTAYISTDYVFDGREGSYREDDCPKPLSVYGESKLAGERAVLAAGPRNLVIRVSGLYDDCGRKGFDFIRQRQDPYLAEDHRLSSPVHVDDVVSAVGCLLQTGGGGIYHVAGPDVLSRYEFVQLAALHFPRMPAVFPAHVSPAQAGLRPRDSSLRTERIQALGWRAGAVCEMLPPMAGALGDDGGARALLIDCVGGLLTPRTWLPPDTALAYLDAECAAVLQGVGFWKAAASSLGLTDVGPAGLQERITSRYAPNPPVWNHLRAWKSRFRLALVNNGPSETFRRWVGKYGLNRVFDVLANSEEMGVRKPAAEFYLRVVDLLGVAPARCTLLDDDPRNVAGARLCGMQAALTVDREGFPLAVHRWGPAELADILDGADEAGLWNR